MNKKTAVIVIAGILSLSLCSQNTDGEYDCCSENCAGFIGCITPCCGDRNDNNTVFMNHASAACCGFMAVTGIGGCCAMLCGGACFLPCLRIPESVAYAFIGGGAAMEIPTLCAASAQSIYGCASCLEKRAFIRRIDEIRSGKADRCSLQSWWSCVTDPLLSCCQMLLSPCLGESYTEEQWQLHQDNSQL